ncbi:FAD-dependent oxidoreductase [Microbacterium sp. APC 3898]|uniref:FAD-dependent oxidoreductase n=2 Tax=Planococcus TaxID=1372 RepID=A0ABT7ZHM3_9BACL|nr:MULTISPECIES: FAD-dependent oxidoreductase [Terrabacteria group]MBD8015543.1 FAD-dependent oxidoreductase [Planococcus wigleyi]MDN3426661.1 FAD-dependent oxidoreductase [Planococcus sp. APC 4016]MDN3500375.1 FAD-dependent oxidoreductase [Microbacterium sp. APC 3898]
MVKKYDIAIIGAGAAGLTAAFTGAGFSKKVVLIDKNLPGGECTWSGCIPSKSLINTAKEVHHAKKYSPNLQIDTSVVLKDIQEVIQKVYAGESPEVLKQSGIDFINGYAKFVGPHAVEVDGERIEAKKFILSTGSSPMVPPIEGLDKVSYLTNETIFTQKSFPKSMTILGGGAIGVEMSQALNRIGVKVTLVEKFERILPKDEEELVLMIQQRLINEGVTIHTGATAVKANQQGGQIDLTIEKDGKETTVTGEGLLVALGRKANVKGYNLEKAGVEYDSKSIQVDDHMETTAKGIYAIGDVVGPYQLSHMANAQGITATQNAILPINRKMDYEHVTWCTYTDPELGRSGLSEEEAREKHGDSIRVYEHDYADIDRANTKKDSIGKVKIILDKKGYILGASILGDRAGEIISQIQTIKSLHINMGKLSGVIHPYPTYSEVLVKIGKKVYVDNLLNQPVVKTFNKAKAGEIPAEKVAIYGAATAAGIGIANMAIKNNVKPKLGVENGRLKEMPSTPNAVSSQSSSKDKFVPAWPYNGTKSQAKKNLIGMLKGYEGVTIAQNDENYVYAVAKSKTMRFKDDIEFYFNDADQRIEFRSASRIGYSDAGVNRKRYDEMKNRYYNISAHTRNS